jgi:hypothetical protein
VKKVKGNYLHLVRPAGSRVVGQTRSRTDVKGGEEIAKFLKSLRWSDVTDETRAKGAGYGQVRYYRARVPAGVRAYESVLLWGELDPSKRERVRVVEAFHQNMKPTDPVRYELVSDIPEHEVSVIHMAVGDLQNHAKAPTRRSAFVYTWYPGRITPFVPFDPSKFPAGVHPMATVKAAERASMKGNPFFDFLFSKPKPKVRTFADMAPMAVRQAPGRLDRWRVELLSPDGVAVWRTHSHGGVLLNSMVLSSSPQVGGLRLNDSEAYYIEKKIDEKSWADSADRPEPSGSVAAQTHEFVLESGPYRGWTLRCVPVQRDTVSWDWGNGSPVPRRVSKANPKRNFFRSKPALAQWSVVLKGKDGSVSAHADATDEDLTDVIKRVGRLGHFHAVALASYARKGDKPQMRNDDDLMVEVYAIPRSNPMSRRNPSREPTFTLFRDGEVVSRRPVDYTAMLDFLVFDAGMGAKAQSMIDSLVSGRRESIAFTLRRQRYEVTLARAGGRGGAPAAARRNPLFGYGLPPGKFSMWGRTMGRKMYHHASYDALKPETAVALLVDDLGVSSKAAVAAVQKAASGVVVKVVSPYDPHSYLNVANRGRTQAEASEFVSLVPNPRRNYSSSLFTSGDLNWSEYVPTKYGLKKSADYVRPGQDLVVYSIVKFNEKNVMGSNYGVYRTWNHKDGTKSEYAVSETVGEERAERAAQEDLDGLRRGLLSFKNPKRNRPNPYTF